MAIRVVLAALLTAMVGTARLSAQGVGAPAEDGGVRPHFGFALGAGSIPRAFEPNCVDGWEGSTASAAVEVRGGLRWGRFGIETRTAPQTELGLGGAGDCLTPDPVRPDGTHRVRSSTIDRGPFIVTDFRGYAALLLEPVEWLVSVGGGWVWSRGVPAAVLGTGIRFGSDLRGVVDVEFSSYRLPWLETTEVWLDSEIVETIDAMSANRWQRAVAVRVGLEVIVQR